jgi:hypothetical protein
VKPLYITPRKIRNLLFPSADTPSKRGKSDKNSLSFRKPETGLSKLICNRVATGKSIESGDTRGTIYRSATMRFATPK